MEKQNELAWAGESYRPLPYESTLSVLLWFAWRNALSLAQLKKLCSKKNLSSKKLSFLDIAWIDSGHLCNATALQLPLQHELDALSQLVPSSELWMRPSHLHYCPICLEDGYHSFWFQFELLHQCPIHHCKLQNVCQCCGGKTPEYRMGSDLFQRPYFCSLCGGPLSGAVPRLGNHRNARENARIYLEAFADLTVWANKRGVGRDIVAACRLEPFSFIRWHAWCRPQEMLRSAACIGNPIPYICTAPRYDEFTVIRWRVRWFENDQPDYESPRRVWERRTRTSNPVYLATLRLLERWIGGRYPTVEEKYVRCISEHGYFSEIPELAALALLRRAMEPFTGWDSREASLADEPNVFMLYKNGRSPRLAWRAFFLGAYAVLLWVVRRGRVEQAKKEVSLIAKLAQMVPWSMEVKDGYVSGAVFFPKLDPVPLRPFKDNGSIEKGTARFDLPLSSKLGGETRA